MCLLRRLLGVAVATLALVVLYGVAVEPRVVLDEQHHEAVLPRLPMELDGTEVAVLSDLQVGMWWANTAMVGRAVDRVVEARPDAVLLAGDFLYGRSQDPPAQIREVIELLAPLLDSGIPLYAVLGNHDYATGAADEMAAALRERGVAVLRNQSAPLSPRGDAAAAVYVVGLGPADLGHSHPQRALEEVPDDAPRVVLMHNPTGFPALPAGSTPLALAGHTHCGQVALPGAEPWSYLGLSGEEAVAADGFAPPEYGAEGNRLFVTCGLGFSLLPVRINAPPQVVFFELRAPAQGPDR